MGIEDETDRTLFIRNLDARVTEELLFELFVQVLLSLTLATASKCQVFRQHNTHNANESKA